MIVKKHSALHLLEDGQQVCTAGRVRKSEQGLELFNLFERLGLVSPRSGGLKGLRDGDLVRVEGKKQNGELEVSDWELISRPEQAKAPALEEGRSVPLGEALRARATLNQKVRHFFADRGFLEVETPAMTRAPGTDPYLEPVRADYVSAQEDQRERAYLHTSPELKMKRLLASGSGPIYQFTRVWRNGEVTALHNPEFTILEWYRPWEGVREIMADVEDLVREVLDEKSGRPLQEAPVEMTMQEVVERCCGFDLLECLSADSLREELLCRGLISTRAAQGADWDELFFSLTVSHLDPFLASLGAVVVTRWPAPLAVLARKCADDPRVAERFELYLDGVELANGFGELVDPREQRRRFQEDNEKRRELGLEEMEMPEDFLEALQWGMPPSAGVALGVDRLLMLAVGAGEIREVAPFALHRRQGKICW